MQPRSTKQRYLSTIRRNIEKSGFHIYVVSGGAIPRFSYTIGLSNLLGFELVLAGASYYLLADISIVFNKTSLTLSANSYVNHAKIEIENLGIFSLGPISNSWANSMMLGWYDYFKSPSVVAKQILPDDAHWTIDIPDLSQDRNNKEQPIWQWLEEAWTYPVPKGSLVATDINALKGAPITEATRWEEDYWEMFSQPAPDVGRENTRMIPLGTLLAYDSSLEAVLRLRMNEGLWRSSASHEWNEWTCDPGGKNDI